MHESGTGRAARRAREQGQIGAEGLAAAGHRPTHMTGKQAWQRDNRPAFSGLRDGVKTPRGRLTAEAQERKHHQRVVVV